EPAISPDGKAVAVAVTTWQIDRGESTSEIWLLSTDGKTQTQLTTDKGKNSDPAWSPDGKSIALVSKRGDGAQIHLFRIGSNKTEQLTKMPMAPSGLKWAPDGKTIYCIAWTWPDTPDDASYQKKTEAIKQRKSKAVIIDDALYRVWNHWI